MWTYRQRPRPRPKRQTREQIKQRSSAGYRRIRNDTTPADSARWEKCSLPLLRKWRPTFVFGLRCPNNYGAVKAMRQEKAGVVCLVRPRKTYSNLPDCGKARAVVLF